MSVPVFWSGMLFFLKGNQVAREAQPNKYFH